MVQGTLKLKISKGVAYALGASLSEEITLLLDSSTAAEVSFQQLHLPPQFCAEGFTDAVFIPVISAAASLGMIVLLKDSSNSIPELDSKRKNILFLLEQSLNSFENVEMYSKARDLIFIDDISGLYNHRYLDIALEREVKRVERYASHLAVLFIDVDSFKLVNDIHGHLVGSRVLAEFGALIKKAVRDADIVIRYGGDEYTVILVEMACAAAGLVTERIRSQVEAHHFQGADGQVIRLTCSIGYACCPEDATSKDALLEMADRAMYSGKTTGKNRVQRISAVNMS
jgi:diguanylate cyclase (GGDEF)-like protein